MSAASRGTCAALLFLVLLVAAACHTKSRAVEGGAVGAPSGASVPDGAVARASDRAPPPFGAPCVADADCATGVCFHKRLKVPGIGRETRDGGDGPVEREGYCSIRCRDDGDCPVPPTKGKCGARGMCKRAEPQ